MKKLLLASILCFSISANANEGKYDDCIVVGDMATEFMTMMQNGLTLEQSLEKIKGVYTSDSGDDAGERFAVYMMTTMYQNQSRVIDKQHQQQKIKTYKQDMIRQCINSVDKRK